MKALIQNVSEARVDVDGSTVGQIGRGLLVFLGVMKEDTDEDLNYLIDKVTNLRLFQHFDTESNKEKYFDKSILDVVDLYPHIGKTNSQIGILVVSQFTLCASTKNGRRPGFDNAAAPEVAKEMYEKFVQKLRSTNTANGEPLNVAEGQFQAHMQVSLVNDGPITITLDSRDR
ncbi:MAG: D-aminoacyl-tRNA deacylase [Candidatus Peregrinibacteria bacterium]|nr:D-aminoacyl-tRNA deacylase [Candidatus Peregrinibacteria bacterium]MDZ4244791.1 D-aminoacyl-tRNA deacylase [Candidatus Gracilibacteria bacterium]